jgi:hypothetical protein
VCLRERRRAERVWSWVVVYVVVEGVWVVREREVGREAVFGVSLWSRALGRRLLRVLDRAPRRGRCKEDGEREEGWLALQTWGC